jgi:hypothetical protein
MVIPRGIVKLMFASIPGIISLYRDILYRPDRVGFGEDG